jgi:hypothetical protein
LEGFVAPPNDKVTVCTEIVYHCFLSTDMNLFHFPYFMIKVQSKNFAQQQHDLLPARRSARQSGTQRREWHHLLRANPDEHEGKLSDAGAETKRSTSHKAKDGKPVIVESSSRSSAANRKDGDTGVVANKEKTDTNSAKHMDCKPPQKVLLKKSRSLPVTSSSAALSVKTAKTVLGASSISRSSSPVDLCERKDEIQERLHDWGILKYR